MNSAPLLQDRQFLRSRGQGAPLRIGVLLDGFTQPAWVARALALIGQSDFAAVAFAVRHRRAPGPVLPAGRLARWMSILGKPERRRHLLYEKYLQWDESRHAPPPESNPFTPVDCTALFAGLPCLDVQPRGARFIHRFRDEDVAAVRDLAPDVLLRFGFNIIHGPMLSAARHGMWSFHHGDNDVYRGGPAHFWELVEHSPESGVLLQVLSEELDAGVVLSKAVVATAPGLSLLRNRVNPYWLGSSFVLRKLHELHEHGWEKVKARAVPPQPAPKASHIYRRPGNGQMVSFLADGLTRAGRSRLRRASAWDYWRIGWRRSPRPAHAVTPFPAAEFQWLASPRGRFFADPFLLDDPDGGAPWLLYEDLECAVRRGVLRAARLSETGELTGDRVILDTGGHLSYPFAWREPEGYYMIPESAGARRVDLYRADHPGGPWRLEAPLLEDAAGLDTTVWRDHDGRWWMWTCLQGPARSGPELWLFHAPAITGPWTPHPANPVGQHVRHSRPAGAIIVTPAGPLRPVQDNSVRYGYQLHFRLITALSPDDYREEAHSTVAPALWPNLEGVHTYNRLGEWEVIDGIFPGGVPGG